jgi:hypothetical protein
MNIFTMIVLFFGAAIPTVPLWVVGVVFLNAGYNHHGPHEGILVKEFISVCHDKYGHKEKCSAPYHVAQDFVYLKDPTNSNSTHGCTLFRGKGYSTIHDINNHIDSINNQIESGVIYSRTIYGSVGDDHTCLDEKIIDYYKQVGWGCLAPVFLVYAVLIVSFLIDCFCNQEDKQRRDHEHRYEPTPSSMELSSAPTTPHTSQLPNTEGDIELANVVAVIKSDNDAVAIPADVRFVKI